MLEVVHSNARNGILAPQLTGPRGVARLLDMGAVERIGGGVNQNECLKLFIVMLATLS